MYKTPNLYLNAILQNQPLRVCCIYLSFRMSSRLVGRPTILSLRDRVEGAEEIIKKIHNRSKRKKSFARQ